MAIAGYDGSIAVWDVDSRSARRKFSLDGVPAIAFSADNKTLAAGTGAGAAPGVVHRWNAATGDAPRRLAHDGGGNRVARLFT